MDSFTLPELKITLKKFKKKKAPGPDEIPMEIFLEMNDIQLEKVLDILNKWWENEEFPEEHLKARIVLIFKNKGSSSNIDNYRPIALTNSIYKIFTASIQKRIAAQIESFLQKTQYGFRKEKSTAHALHIIRRIMDVGYRAGQQLSLILLDWEKAFDTVDHEAMHRAFERMNIPEKYRNILKQIYKNPTFKIEIDGQSSEWKQQQTGIRQGCPLSPYLFLIVMTAMFYDIHDDPILQEN